jgi:HSP20 family molecular chaperone IbpA
MAEETMENTVRDHGEDETPTTREQAEHLIPAVDIYEKGEDLIVVADLPGVSKENLTVEVDNNVLTIHGRIKADVPSEPTVNEFELLDYFRQFKLSRDVDQERIDADLKHGVLRLVLPKAEHARPRRIQVKTE